MKPGMQWPIGVALILATTVIGNLIVMRVANNDPSFAIEPDYYAKGVAFDSTIAEQRLSAHLGWVAQSEFAVDSASKSDVVTVTLTDRNGQPVEHAAVTVTAFYNARANDILSANLTESAPGKYHASLDVKFAGQWEVRVRATRLVAGLARETFEATTRAEAQLPPSAIEAISRVDLP
ncbi:MAG: FixH family protein [Gemmatimonadaceae bacterium]